MDVPPEKEDTPNVSFKAALLAEMDRRGHNHTQAAAEMDFIQQRVSAWARGDSLPDRSAHPVLARYLRVSETRLRGMIAFQRAQPEPIEQLTAQVQLLRQQVDLLMARVFPAGAPR